MPYKDPTIQKAAQAKHYQDNKGKYAQSSKNARFRRKQKIIELKNKPCTDCGVRYPHYVMQFDHIDDNKIDSVSKLMIKSSWQTVLDEIAKCELVCANCHASRTYQRANGY